MTSRGIALAAVAGLVAANRPLHGSPSGLPMPVISLGHPDDPDSCCRQQPTNTSCCREMDCLKQWWDAGGVGVDTAHVYGTQDPVGRALAAYQPKRVFITTKIPCAGAAGAAAALIAQDLQKLNLSTVDLLAIHNNGDDSHYCNNKENVSATWRALQSAHAAGQARSIVSLAALCIRIPALC